MDKLEAYNNELDDLENRIEEAIVALKRMNITNQSDPNFILQQIQTQSDNINDQLEKAKKLYNKINVLTKVDVSLTEPVNESKKKHKEVLSRLRNQFKQAKSLVETKHSNLLANSNNNSNFNTPPPTNNNANNNSKNKPPIKQQIDDDEEVVAIQKDSDNFTNLTPEQKQLHDEIEKELFAEVFATQKECIEIIDRLNKKADETINLAADSAEMLKTQREHLLRIDEELDALGSNITRAQKEVTSFLRRIRTDKFCAVLCLIVVLAIIGGAIFAIVMRFIPKNDNNNPQPQPQPTPKN
ncbi:hypothetical protein ABK040_002406 [Willaertia magna]